MKPRFLFIPAKKNIRAFLLPFSLFALTPGLQAQTGTIKVKKPVGLDFSLLNRSIGANKDSAAAWFSRFGFSEGDLENKEHMELCGGDLNAVAKEPVLFCAYYTSDTLDLKITYTKKGDVYSVKLISKRASASLGTRLFSESLSEGYTGLPRQDGYKTAQKQTRYCAYGSEKGTWWFQLSDSKLLPKINR
jgi:hypothetical protein